MSGRSVRWRGCGRRNDCCRREEETGAGDLVAVMRGVEGVVEAIKD